jgi:hypothetical protein
VAVGLDRLAPGEREGRGDRRILDDHSRLLAGIGACHGHGTPELVWQVMSSAIEHHGVPMTSLSDNGRAYCLRRYRDAGQTAFEINLQAIGCQVITSTKSPSSATATTSPSTPATDSSAPWTSTPPASINQ